MRAMASRQLATLVLGAGLSVALGAVALAQDAPAPGTPPAWDTLVHCAQTPNEGERLACYDAAMRAAGYAPNPAAVAAEHRKTFGLSVPKVHVFKHEKKQEEAQAAAGQAAPEQENPDQIEVTVDQIAITQPAGKILIFTTEGQIWQQTDTTPINSYPKQGQKIEIHRGLLHDYMCDVNKYQSVRCIRAK